MLRRLVASADVLVENFRPEVMERLGLGYEELRKHNPKLVYCAITGFGQEGPMRDAPAYDQIIQGLSGMMSVTGDAQSAPLRAGYPVADTVSGMVGAFAICATLLRRHATGEGGFIDVSMLDSAPGCDGLGGLSELSDRGHRAASAWQRQLHRRAVAAHLPHRIGTAEHRGQQARTSLRR